MAHIVIDRDSLQAFEHLSGQAKGNGPSRLSSFIRAIEHLGHSVSFDSLKASTNDWKGADILIIPTRRPGANVDPVLRDIEQFVSNGGSLFLLSNHSQVPTRPAMGNFTREDGKVARLFDIQLVDACFRTCPQGTRTVISDAGTEAHPILMDGSANRVVNEVVVNNGCAIDRDSAGAAVLLWPQGVEDIGPDNMSPDEMAFCWATETEAGRILVTGDSGFVGEPGLPGSGPGLSNEGDNVRFIQQAIGWLLKS